MMTHQKSPFRSRQSHPGLSSKNGDTAVALRIPLFPLLLLLMSSHLALAAVPITVAMPAVIRPSDITTPKLIVIGFMGGRVSSTNLIHREALLAKELQQKYPLEVHARMFANRDGHRALKAVLELLGAEHGSVLSDEQKRAARIVIFGHSWGASETVTLANRLNALNIPVLLTVQVDSVQKRGENDRYIPPNVMEAVNFYQTEGMLRGRRSIVAVDPSRTIILGNYRSSYKETPISVAGFPWYARMFMRPHIEIENDPAVWNQVEALICSKIHS
jgi:pimeloyl-ACP methyl ester carboxylesterase